MVLMRDETTTSCARTMMRTRTRAIGYAYSMPLYIYRCTRCEREIEELQKFEDPAPVLDEPCRAPDVDEASGVDNRSCDLVRVPTSGHFDFPHASFSNVGRSGWQQHGSTVYRQIQGK